MAEKNQNEPTLDPRESPSLRSWGEAPDDLPKKNVAIECGWGKLLFGHTFGKNQDIADILQDEKEGLRDIALYIRDPQVVVAKSPQDLFIDPSFTYRLLLKDFKGPKTPHPNFKIREIDIKKDLGVVNEIYQARGMVQVEESFITKTYKGRFIKYWVAKDKKSGDLLGVAMGIDHKKAFDDPENGSSIWAVAVDPRAQYPGVGIALVEYITDFYKTKGRAFVDVSVLHNNNPAKKLYEKLGFRQVPVFCIKNKNAINEKLFTPEGAAKGLNIYAGIIVDEAERRGIKVEILDAGEGYFRLTHGGRSVICRESLSELTSSIAMSRCMDKHTTNKLLKEAGLNVPAQQIAGRPKDNIEFLEKHEKIVVKPAFGEQGRGITVDVTTKDEMKQAVEYAGHLDEKIILEEMVEGEDLRIIVIDRKVVAAATRKPPTIIGDGETQIEVLIKKLSRRREKATSGESKIPVDNELKRTVHNAGYSMDEVLPKNRKLEVRKTANLHTGGTIHDVTPGLHPKLIEAAEEAARALDIPVVGLDFMVKSPKKPDYLVIEANERPGLANHEPQPTAERFIDLLFPQTRPPKKEKKANQ